MDERAGELNYDARSGQPDSSEVINDYVDRRETSGRSPGNSGLVMGEDPTDAPVYTPASSGPTYLATSGDTSYTSDAPDTADNDDNPDTTAETAAIREDIEQTRSQLSQTIDKIQARLAPERLVDDAKETAKEKAEEVIDNVKQTVRDATVGRVETMVNNVSQSGNGVMDLIKQNPIPAAMAGLGLGWLWMNRQNTSKIPQAQQTRYSTAPYSYGGQPSYQSGQSQAGSGGLMGTIKSNPVPVALAGASLGYMLMNKNQSQSSASSASRYTNDYIYGRDISRQGDQGLGDKVGNIAGTAGDKLGQVGSKAGDVAGSAASKVGDVAGSVGDVAGSAASKVGDVASNVVSGTGDVVGNVASGVQHGAQKVESQFERVLNENPLMIGAAAVALGALVGLMLPGTQQENQLLGQARDSVVEKVSDVASETIDKVGNVANQVQQTAKNEAKNQGLAQ